MLRVARLWSQVWSKAMADRDIARELEQARLSPGELREHFSDRRRIVLARLEPEVEALLDAGVALRAGRRALAVTAVARFGLLAAELLLVVSVAAPIAPDRRAPAATGAVVLGGVCLWTIRRNERVLRYRSRARTEWGAAVNDFRSRLERLLAPQIRRTIYDVRSVPFDAIDVCDASGLAEDVDPGLEVETRARDELAQALARRRSGMIGIVGASGTGKTTLIHAVCDGRLKPEGLDPPLALRVIAPARWDAGEFVSYLFAELCLKVAPRLRDNRPRLLQTRRRHAALLGIVGLLCGVLIAATVLAARRALYLHVSSHTALVVGLGLAAVVAAIGFAMLVAYAVRPASRRLAVSAGQWLAELRFRQSTMSGWSFGTTPTLGFAVGGKREATAVKQPMAVPEIVTSYCGFVGEVAATRPVVVGIDEMDKLESAEEARAFLRGIRLLAGQRGCVYVISISDELLGQIESGLLDEVVPVEPLSYAEARTMLRGRVLGVGEAYLSLIYVLSCGIPRELIRRAREVVAAGGRDGSTSSAVAWTVIAGSLERSERSFERAAVGSLGFDGAHPTLGWLRGLAALRSPQALSERWRIGAAYRALARHPNLQRGLLVHAATVYQAATVLDIWRDLTPGLLTSLATGERAARSLLEQLAIAGHELGFSPRNAWRSVSAVRSGFALEPLSFPLASE